MTTFEIIVTVLAGVCLLAAGIVLYLYNQSDEGNNPFQ